MKRFTRFIAAAVAIPLLVSGLCIADNDGTASSDNTYSYSDKDHFQQKEHDNGFVGDIDTDKDDPHYGWGLGSFVVTGFTRRMAADDGSPIFLKTVGDQVKITFKLEQNIDKLNGNKDYSISEDWSAQDEYYQTKAYKDCRGLLIVRKIDYENKIDDEVYHDYLKGAKKGADIDVDLFEEGDYEIALDYEIMDDVFGPVNGFTDYQLKFKFSIRNGNCMVYPKDLDGNELQDQSHVESGFYLDLANSRYLDISIKKAVITSDGFSDTRFNKVATDNEEFREEGIYTIKVVNPTTGDSTEKTIYVGNDPVLISYVAQGMNYEEIKAMISEGNFDIDDEGNIIPATSETDVSDESEAVAAETGDEINPTTDNTKKQAETETGGTKVWVWVAIIVLGIVATISIVDSVYIRKRKKEDIDKVENDDSDNDNENENECSTGNQE